MQGVVPTAGDVVWIRQRRWRVERAIRDGDVLRLDVANRSERLTFLAPFDRPAGSLRTERPRRARPQEALARLAHLVSRSASWRTPLSAVDADVMILPHQLEPVLAMLGGARRILLADEVGLGKTIQAGLVIAECLRRHAAPRVLVLVPPSLSDQWIDELERRFRLTCRVADRTGLDAAIRSGARHDNPWQRAGVWIGSLDYVKQPHILDTLPVQPWDLVVVDEAHEACGASDRHAACDELARHARQLLLLTATPHTGDTDRFNRLTSLGALAGIVDPLIVLRRTRAGLSLAPRPNIRWHHVGFSQPEHALLDALEAFERAILAAAGTARRDAALLLLSVFRKRALSTMYALARSLERRLEWLDSPERAYRFEWLQPGLRFESDTTDEIGPDEADALVADAGMNSRRERAWIRRLLMLAGAARRRDSRIERVAALVARSQEPLVVFTEFRDSLHALKPRLAASQSVAVLHGGQTIAERRVELGRFLRGAASVLLATDVAGQGLNLQERTRWVLSLDLPWNPGRLEQRAGRVDRIGQSKRVHVTLLVGRHQIETAILARLARRTVAARRTLGPDVLIAGAPDRAVIAAAIEARAAGPRKLASLPGASVPAPISTATSIRLDGRWARLARVMACRLQGQRALASRWRAPDAQTSRPLCVRAGRGRLPHALSPAVAVFGVPLVDSSGAIVEQHVVPIRFDSAAVSRPALEAARHLAGRALAKRASLVSRRCRSRVALLAERERAIAKAFADSHWPDEVQPGLFSRREGAIFEKTRRNLAGIRARTAASANRDQGSDKIRVGRPALELLFASHS